MMPNVSTYATFAGVVSRHEAAFSDGWRISGML